MSKKHDVRAVRKIGIFLTIPGMACNRAISGFYRFARQRSDWRIYQIPNIGDGTITRVADAFRPDAIFTNQTNILDIFATTGRKRPPYVLQDNILPGYPDRFGSSINVDNLAIGRLGAERLHALGYRNFAYLGLSLSALTNPDSAEMLLRYSHLRGGAFERAVHEFGCTASVLHQRGKPGLFDVSHQLADWLRSLPKPCGILAFCDEDAAIAINVAHELRIPVPGKLGFIGIDNEEYICDNVNPPVSSIEPDFEGAGYKAAEIIARQLDGDRAAFGARIVYGIRKLEERMSTQSIMSAINRLAKARELIRSRFGEPLSPQSVANDLGIARRTLEGAFTQSLGHGIYAEILAVRLRHARRLLQTTRMPIGDIASKCGFGSYATFVALYVRRFGEAPGKLRKS